VKPEDALRTLGLALPDPPKPVGAYLPCVRAGNLVFVSGQLPFRDGRLAFAGKIPADVSVADGATAARQAALNALAIAAHAVGGMANIARVVRLGVFVNSSAGFVEQPKVANGASDFLAAVFGEAGKHARVAVGVSELPLNAAVEVELLVEAL